MCLSLGTHSDSDLNIGLANSKGLSVVQFAFHLFMLSLYLVGNLCLLLALVCF